LLAPAWEIFAVSGIWGFYLLAEVIVGDRSLDTRNLIGPWCLTVVLGLSAWRIVKSDAAGIWTALFWFRISTAVYFGIGSVIPILADDELRQYLRGFFLFYGADIAKVNLITAVAVTIVLLSGNVYLILLKQLRGRGNRASAPALSRDGTPMFTAGLLFLLVGGTTKYLLIVPQLFGIAGTILPGSAASLGSFTYAALFLLTAWSREHAKKAFPFVVAFASLELLIGILAFNKSEVLIVMTMFLLGLLRRRITLWSTGIVVAVLLVCYLTIVPAVNFGRTELWARYPGETGAGFGQRVEILSDYLSSDSPASSGRGLASSSAAARLSYTNQSAFAVNEYDKGRPGK